MNNVLVSILILSYNSAETILETLESAYNQTYNNIELIVSDDGSTDNTIALVNDWILHHEKRFRGVKVREGHSNVGVSKNFNLAMQLCSGMWIKPIGADDLLLPNCIDDYIKIADQDETIGYYLSGEIRIDKAGNYLDRSNYEMRYLEHFAALPTAAKQYRVLLTGDISLTPTGIIRRSVFAEIGGCDESFPNFEDYVLRLRVLKGGYKIGCLNKETVAYRVHNSISHSETKMYNVSFEKTVYEMKMQYCYPYVSKLNFLFWISEMVEWVQKYIIIHYFNNQNIKGVKLVCRVLNLLNPRRWRRYYVYKLQDLIMEPAKRMIGLVGTK